MKKLYSFLLVTMLVAMSGVFTSCSEENLLVGTWRCNGETITFNDKGTFSFAEDEYVYWTGTYTFVKENNSILLTSSTGDSAIIYVISIDNSSLVLSDEPNGGDTITYIRV